MLAIIAIAIIISFLILFPFVAIVYQSFWSSMLGLGGHPTLANYVKIWNEFFLSTLMNSLILAFFTSLFSTLVGFFISYAVTRTDIPFKGLLDTLMKLPFYFSPLILALAYSYLLRPAGFLSTIYEKTFNSSIFWKIESLEGMIIVSTLWLTSYAYMMISSGLKNIVAEVEDVARIAGAGWWQTTRRIVLPLITPVLISCIFFSFVIGLGELSIPMILGHGKGIYVLSTYILYLKSAGVYPELGQASVVALIMVIFAVAFLFINKKVTGISSKYVTIVGRGGGQRVIHLGRFRWFVVSFIFLWIVSAVALPVATVFLISLSPTWRVGIPTQFTLKFYFDLLSGSADLSFLVNSLQVSLASALCIVILSAILAYLIVRRSRLLVARSTETLVMFMSSIPGMALATGFLIAYIRIPLIYGTPLILIIAFTIRFLPQSLRTCVSSLLQQGEELEHVAACCGASTSTRLFKIIIPLLLPALLAAFNLSLASTIGEISSASLLCVPATYVLSIAAYENWTVGEYYRAAGNISIVAFIAISASIIFEILSKKRIQLTAL